MTEPLHRAGWTAAILASAALGWLLAGGDDPPPAPRVSRPPLRERQAANHRGPPAPVQAALQVIREASEPIERLRATIELANSLPVADLEAWLGGHWFDLRGGPEFIVFKDILTTRWQHEDPAGCAAWAMTHDPGLAETTLNAWATRAPQAVLAFFKAHTNDRLEMDTMTAVAAVDPAVALARMRELLAANPATRYPLFALRTLAMKVPAELTAVLDTLPPAARNAAESELVGQRLTVDFAGELRRLIEKPDGLWLMVENFGQVAGAADGLLAHLNALPPEWQQFMVKHPELLLDENHPEKLWRTDLEAAGFSADQVWQLREKVLDRLTTSQPRQVLGWLDEVDLGRRTRRALIEKCLSSASSPAEKTALVALLKSTADRQVATAILEQPAPAPAAAKAPDPGAWLTEAAAWDPEEGSFYSLVEDLDEMSREQLADLEQRFQALPEDQKIKASEALIDLSGRDFSPTLKGDAIRCLIASPPDDQVTASPIKFRVNLAANHAAQWAQTDPTAAGAWAITLPPGAPKFWAMRNVAATWATYDPTAAKQWVDSLPAADRKEVADYLKQD
jgi:hypothetical protein